MNKLTFTLFTILAPLLFLQTNCKDEPTPPQIEQPKDTTSHNFVVTRIDTLGDLFSSARAVDIVDENNIWVVGEFYEKDTANNYNLKYNLAHWNGITWNLIGIKMQGFGGSADTSIQPLITIRVFGDSSIIVTSQYSSFARYNGIKWVSFSPPEGVWEHFWARSANEIYFVGSFGSVTYYNGQTFTKMSTGLTTNALLTDVWGDEQNVYTLGSSSDMKESAILYTDKIDIFTIANRYSVDNQTPSPTSMYMGRMWSIFRANAKTKLWVLGGEDHGWLYEVTSLSPFSAKIFFVVPDVFYPRRIRGNADNDLFLFGELGAKIWHYNAKSWKLFEPAINSFLMHDCSVKANTIAIVGESIAGITGKGIVVTLKHF